MRKLFITLFLALVSGPFGVIGANAGQLQLSPFNKPNAMPVAPAASGTLGMAQLAARVNGLTGQIYSGAGATGGSKLFPGTYEVDFGRDVSQCFYAATLFLTRSTQTIFTEPRSSNNNGVFIEIIDSSNSPVDSDFYLLVFCAQ